MTKLTTEFQRLKTVKEAKKVLSHLKAARTELTKILKSKNRSQEIRKYADLCNKEVRKRIKTDVTRIHSFLDRAKGELEDFQTQYLNPGKTIKETVTKLKKIAKPKRARHATKGKHGSDKETAAHSTATKHAGNGQERPTTSPQ